MRTYSHEPPYLSQMSDEEGVGVLDILFCRIAGHTWRYTCVSEEQMEIIGIDGADNPGICSPSNQVIYIKEDSIHHDVIIHELVHAYKDTLCIGAAKLTEDQLEEVFCELFAYNWWKILRLANQIYHNLTLLKDVHAGARAKDMHWELPHADETADTLAEELDELVLTYVDNGRNIFSDPAHLVAKKKPRKASRKTRRKRLR